MKRRLSRPRPNTNRLWPIWIRRGSTCDRSVIHSPVNGWVTNLLAQRGDYATEGQNVISLVDANSFWVDGYFEETSLDPIHVGDPAEIKLMGYPEILHGHVDSIARAINVANAQPNGQGVANGQSDLHLGAPGAARFRCEFVLTGCQGA